MVSNSSIKMKIILFFIIGSVIVMCSTIEVRESFSERLMNFPKMLISEVRKKIIRNCLSEANLTYAEVAALKTRDWTYQLNPQEETGLCCWLRPVVTVGKLAKYTFLRFLDIGKALEVSDANAKVPISEIIKKCEENVGISSSSVNYCRVEPKSAQFVHCFTSSLNEATDGKFFESVSFDASEIDGTPSDA
ncbi:uncharacterized protein LOC129566505 [Sitodiplosis mosellana]|uniref:uncharacterized protein LOC129566505 n=1 Tax=Sitodiplosis mosellana TaxID=263140 RepID=UPI002444FB9A|nr:uncharacterized protein LOC129566505 [Sitodiplosis mosellana]